MTIILTLPPLMEVVLFGYYAIGIGNSVAVIKIASPTGGLAKIKKPPNLRWAVWKKCADQTYILPPDIASNLAVAFRLCMTISRAAPGLLEMTAVIKMKRYSVSSRFRNCAIACCTSIGASDNMSANLLGNSQSTLPASESHIWIISSRHLI